MKGNKAFKRILAILITAALIIVPVIYTLFRMGVFITEPKKEYLPDEKNDKVIHVVGDYDFAPYSFLDSNGNPTGLDVEAVTEICNRMGCRADIKLMSWPAAVGAIQSGKADLIMGEDITDMSDPSMISTLPIIDDDLVIWSKNRIRSLSDVYGKKIGIINNGVSKMNYASLVGSMPIEKDSYDDLFEACNKGDIDFVLCHQTAGHLLVYEKNLPINSTMFFSKNYLGYGLPANSPITTEVNSQIEELYRDGTRDKLYDKWINKYAGHYSLSDAVRRHLDMYFVFAILWIVWIVVIILVKRNEKIYLRELETENAHKRELKEALDLAEKANTAKSVFLFNMSHDIRTPLNAILGSAQLAKAKKDSEGRLDTYLNSIILSGKYLLGVLNDVLEMSRIENNRLIIEEHLTDTDKLREECIALVKELIGNKDVEFIEDNNTPTRYIYVDTVHTLEIFMNLVSNAVKYTPEGGTIKVITREKPGRSDDEIYVVTTYEDTGIGMSEEFLEHAFESFEREKTTASANLTGTGLGLAIVKRLVDLMNGTIDITSKKGEGTKIVVSLPHRIGNAPTKDEEQLGEHFIDRRGLHVLLAEDNDINADIVTEFFTDEGFIVDRVRDGEECIELLTKSPVGTFDIILMDIQMPHMNGYEAAKKIRALDDSELANIPIVALTANAFKEDIDKALDAGMNDHIAKPVDVPKMLSVLDKVLK